MNYLLYRAYSKGKVYERNAGEKYQKKARKSHILVKNKGY